MIPKIVSVNISQEKGTVKTPVGEIMIDGRGIKGDAHSGLWHRQVSLLSAEIISGFSKEIGRNIPYGEFAENITTEGLDLSLVSIFDRFQIGDVVLEVSQIGKECHGDKCAIFREVGKCVMPHAGIFCRVIHCGRIVPGAQIRYIPKDVRISVITLSDRACSGEYEDKSGPAIVGMMKDFFSDRRWRLDFNRKIIQDDSFLLKNAIMDALWSGTDIIFTTGGTGIGPRDITPDVVSSLVDKEIPGIMEYIRVKYGAINPNALLSRSVAGVLGNTLIYTLPGSVKAATEYMNEILKIIEHSVFMQKNVSIH